MGKLVPVAKIHDVPDGEAISVEAEGERIAIFNVNGKLYAISDMCAHAGGPISEGWVTGTRVTCPWHGWQFELDPDQATENDGMYRYKVKVQGEDIFIEIE